MKLPKWWPLAAVGAAILLWPKKASASVIPNQTPGPNQAPFQSSAALHGYVQVPGQFYFFTIPAVGPFWQTALPTESEGWKVLGAWGQNNRFATSNLEPPAGAPYGWLAEIHDPNRILIYAATIGHANGFSDSWNFYYRPGDVQPQDPSLPIPIS